MSLEQKLLAVLIASALLLTVVELIRRKRLRERYALLWIGAAAFFLFFSLKTQAFTAITRWLGFILPANALFFFGMIAMTFITLAMTVAVSRLARRTERLAQELSLLLHRVECIEKEPKQ